MKYSKQNVRVSTDFLHNLWLKQLSLQEGVSEIILKVYIVLHEEYPLFISDFYETKFLDRFSKNSEKSNVMKIRPVGAELFYAD
jgi:hypothetical protein